MRSICRTWIPFLAGGALLAQAPAPSLPTLKWRGSIWASGVTQQRHTADGTLFLRTVDPGEDAFSLDGLTLGVDADLGKGWSVRATLLGGHTAKVLNTASGETGTLAFSEAQLVWTGEKDTLRFGRMNTYLGMEYLDGTQDITASRGLLYNFADPFGQVGLGWHHAFTPTWSADLWVFNGEDRVQDNNHSKTWGLGVTYNHGGAADKYVSLQAYRGAEQDGRGASANTGAEGRHRTRLAMMGQWVWGPATLQWEASFAKETFAAGALAGTTEEQTAGFGGVGAIFRYAVTERWGVFARAESFSDEAAVRLGFDTTVAAAYPPTWKADLKATSLALGVDHRYGPAFMRLEVRTDRLNKDVTDLDGQAFRDGASATLSVGASF